MSHTISGRSGIAVGKALVLLTALLSPEPATAGGDDVHWEPAKTRVFIASLCWYKDEEKPDFAPDERLDGKMAVFFQEHGVPKKQIKLLLDADATVSNVKTEFAQFMRDSKAGELLVCYLSGHGYPGGFYLFDDTLESEWFFDAIEKDYRGARAFLMADCCFSGGIVELAQKRKTSIGYACLSSTFSQQTAWSGWRFAQCLMRGFEGNPIVDLNGDGHVDLEELADYSGHYMAFVAEGKPMFTTTSGFNSKLQLAKTRGKKKEHLGELVEAQFNDEWTKAEIIGVTATKFKVHFTEDTKADNDSAIDKSEVRPFEFKQFEVGDHLRVKSGSDGKWHPAKVLETFDSLCLCRIQGKSSEYDEWFGPDRIREKRPRKDK